MNPIILRSPINRGFTLWPFIFMPDHAQGKPEYLAHEMVHWKRQAWWTPVWVLLYLLFKSFRWREEKLAFYTEIRFLVDTGSYVNRFYYISGMVNEYRDMVGVHEATVFVNQTADG